MSRDFSEIGFSPYLNCYSVIICVFAFILCFFAFILAFFFRFLNSSKAFFLKDMLITKHLLIDINYLSW